jgi:hypothetical protein
VQRLAGLILLLASGCSSQAITIPVWFERAPLAETSMTVLDEHGRIEWSNEKIDIWRHLEDKGTPLEVMVTPGPKTLIFIDESAPPMWQTATIKAGTKLVLRRPKTPHVFVPVDIRDSANRNFRRATVRVDTRVEPPPTVKSGGPADEVVARYRSLTGSGGEGGFHMLECDYHWMRSGVFRIQFMTVPSKFHMILPEPLSHLTSLVAVVQRKEYPFEFTWKGPNVFKLPVEAIPEPEED